MSWLARLLAWLSGRREAPAAPVPPAPPPEPPAAQAPALSPVDRDVLIRTVYGEARGEPESGQIAVVHVVRNRLKRPKRFRDTPAGICQQPWQFSCWNDSDPNRARLEKLHPYHEDYLRLGRVVDKAWALPDTVDGADHYYAMSMPAPPAWALHPQSKVTVSVGNHIFLRVP